MRHVEEERLEEQDERHPLVVSVVYDRIVLAGRSDARMRQLTLLHRGSVQMLHLNSKLIDNSRASPREAIVFFPCFAPRPPPDFFLAKNNFPQ